MLILFSFAFVISYGQNSKAIKAYQNNTDELKSSEILNFYFSTFDTEYIDSLMLTNGLLLKSQNQTDYVTHELARVLFYKVTQRLDTALTLIDKLNYHPVLKTNQKLQASHETLYGIICYDLARPKIARTHYLNGLSTYSILKDSVGIKGNLINIGTTHFLEEQFDSAEYYFNKAKTIEDLGIITFHQNLYNNLATVYQNTNRYDEAIASYKNLIDTDINPNSTHYYNLGLAYFKNKQFKESVEMLEKATSIEYDNSNIYLSSVYSALSQSQKKIGNNDRAYDALFKADSLKVIEDKETANRLLDELKLKHQEKIFEDEKKLAQEKITRKKLENWFLLVVLISLGIILVIITILFVIKNKKNKILFQKNIELTNQRKKKDKPKTNSNVSHELIKSLEKLLHEKEVYINPKLTLDKLAKQLNTNRTYLSENINSHYKLSFSALINQLRIKKSREMLIDPEFINYSIEGIANTVGYNSISTFNATFKKETGITPSYFRKKGVENF